MAPKRRGWRCRAFLFLLVVPAPLAEILSENVPLLKFFNPVVAALLILSYGLPVLLIRELAAARRIGVAGLFLLGLAYGIYNGGILACTLTLPEGHPVEVFASFGKTGPLQMGWALMIVPWHALHSVINPILITCWMFPAAAPFHASSTGALPSRPGLSGSSLLVYSFISCARRGERRPAGE